MRIFDFIKEIYIFFLRILTGRSSRLLVSLQSERSGQLKICQLVQENSSYPAEKTLNQKFGGGRIIERRKISKELSTMFGNSRITINQHNAALENISGMKVESLVEQGIVFLNGENEVGIVRSSGGASFLKRRITEILIQANNPQSTKEIILNLSQKSITISKTGVNSILYKNSKTVFKVGEDFRWQMAFPVT